jgi:hypothetical protein
LEGLKNREADQEGNPFTPSLFHSFNLFNWLTTFLIAVLANNLKTVQQALSDEKSVRLRAENSLAEERAARQAAEQSFQQSNDANATLVLELETAHTSLAATRDKLNSESKALDFQVIRADEVVLRLKNAESWWRRPEEPKSAIGVGSEDCVQARRLIQHDDFLGGGPWCGAVQESSSWSDHGASTPDFTMDDEECTTLVSSTFDAAQDFVSSYDFTSIVESDDNDSPKAL